MIIKHSGTSGVCVRTYPAFRHAIKRVHMARSSIPGRNEKENAVRTSEEGIINAMCQGVGSVGMGSDGNLDEEVRVAAGGHWGPLEVDGDMEKGTRDGERKIVKWKLFSSFLVRPLHF